MAAVLHEVVAAGRADVLGTDVRERIRRGELDAHWPESYYSRKLRPSACRRAFSPAGTGVWNRPGMYQRNARPSALRWHTHSGGQPHLRPRGFWIRAIADMRPGYA